MFTIKLMTEGSTKLEQGEAVEIMTPESDQWDEETACIPAELPAPTGLVTFVSPAGVRCTRFLYGDGCVYVVNESGKTVGSAEFK